LIHKCLIQILNILSSLEYSNKTLRLTASPQPLKKYEKFNPKIWIRF
jgi:hypothetical protein